MVQAILFHRNTFKPSITPKGIRFKAARNALIKATIQNMSCVTVATRMHPIESRMLVMGPERAVFPALSFVTGLTEETVFRGYIFSRLSRLWKNEWLANLASSFLFALIYLPVAIFVLGYQPTVMLVYLLFVFS